MSGHLVLDIIVALAIVVGLVGAVVQVYPGLMIVGGAVAIWGVITRGNVGWTMLAVAILIVIAGTVLKYLISGRYLSRQGVPNRSIVVGALFGIVGFFVIPFVGLIVGFILGTYVSEWQRLNDPKAAKDATWVAIKATGLSILIELGAALTLAVIWAGALFWH